MRSALVVVGALAVVGLGVGGVVLYRRRRAAAQPPAKDKPTASPAKAPPSAFSRAAHSAGEGLAGFIDSTSSTVGSVAGGIVGGAYAGPVGEQVGGDVGGFLGADSGANLSKVTRDVADGKIGWSDVARAVVPFLPSSWF